MPRVSYGRKHRHVCIFLQNDWITINSQATSVLLALIHWALLISLGTHGHWHMQLFVCVCVLQDGYERVKETAEFRRLYRRHKQSWYNCRENVSVGDQRRSFSNCLPWQSCSDHRVVRCKSKWQVVLSAIWKWAVCHGKEKLCLGWSPGTEGRGPSLR
jgi:hypothetical protein